MKAQQFFHQDLRGVRFVESDLSGVVMRGVVASGMDIDAPWLSEGDGLLVNGVDVTGFVEAELDRRFPGRELRRASDPAALRSAWDALSTAWASIREHVASLIQRCGRYLGRWRMVVLADAAAPGVRHRHVAGQGGAAPRATVFHPIGLRDTSDGPADSPPETEAPPYADVVAVWVQRAAMVETFLADVTLAALEERRPSPHEPARSETVLSCLHVIFEEGWEHLRFAARDIGVLESRPS